MDDQAICGLTVRPLPEGWTPLEAVAVVKCLDQDGRTALVVRATDGLCTWDRIGMLRAAVVTNEADLAAEFIQEEGDDGGVTSDGSCLDGLLAT